MKPEEIRQLLGGYASGTLSEAEKKLLFEAALEDQVLFDAMADEQALKDLLDASESRGYLQAVLDEVPASPEQLSWVQTRTMALPAPQVMPVRDAKVAASRRPAMWWGALAAAALAAVSVIGILRMDQKRAVTEVAKNDRLDRPQVADRVSAEPAATPKAATSSPTGPAAPETRAPFRAATVRERSPAQPESRKSKDEGPAQSARAQDSRAAPSPIPASAATWPASPLPARGSAASTARG